MQGSTVDCVDHYMANIVQDPSWTGAAQWIGDPLSFKDRKIIEQLSAAHALSHEAAETDEESFFEPPVDEEATEPSNNQEIAPVTPLNSEIFSPDAAISLGENWHWYEHEAGEVFRWVTNDAELRLPACSNGDEIAELNLDVEPGPSINRIHCTLKLIDEQNQLIAQGRFSGRQVVTLVPTEDLSGKTVKLQVETDNLPLSSEDVRILNFRVFNVSLKMKDSVKSENDHPVHAADTFYGISKTALESKSANESEENLAVHENFAPPIREAASSR
jgi:hypothetical protein